MGAVREHGGGAAAAQGAGRPLRAAARGGGRHLRGPALLPRPRRLHGRGLHLRQPPHRAPRPRRGQRHPRPAAPGAGLQEASCSDPQASAAASRPRGGAGAGLGRGRGAARAVRSGEGRQLRRRGKGGGHRRNTGILKTQ
jgi:hypothetical protein